MISLEDIRASDQIKDDLEWPFDFALHRAEDDFTWINLDPDVTFEAIAGSAAGDVFLAYGHGVIEERPILFVTSEGQSGRVASNLNELLALLVSIPYWRDLLKFSAGGDIAEMRLTKVHMHREYDEDYEGWPIVSKRLIKQLRITPLEDPIQYLHTEVTSTDCVVVASDGWRYESLFNSFKSSDNPNWR